MKGAARQGSPDRKRCAAGAAYMPEAVFQVPGPAIFEELLGDEPGILAQRQLDLARQLGIVAQEALGVLAPLAEALAVIGEPGARLLDDAGLDAEVDELAGLRHALAIHDVELDLLEGRRQLVLDHLDAGLVADDLVAILDRADAADVEAHRGIELERIAAGGRLRASRTSRRSSCGSG
jgi:hypothetical protein